ncbi:MAG TPA: (4Fe-4S)-binding protein [Dehalococcoidia bacterium]|jgi:uncharacterized Fe-S cluster protein YjdI|nr:(4Fe-4S)-binding protein [Dehalococcoidia bacterium]
MASNIVRRYRTDEVIVIWQPALCAHSGNCTSGLPEVFNARVRPWVKPEAASTEALIEAICRCPSGALSYELVKPNMEADEP